MVHEHEAMGMVASQKHLGIQTVRCPVTDFQFYTVSNAILVKLEMAQKLWELSEAEVEMLLVFFRVIGI